MSILRTPDGIPVLQTSTCAICLQHKKLILLSAGMRSASGEQAFACDAHFRDTRSLVIGWINYAAKQRRDKLPFYGIDGDMYEPIH